VSKLVLVSIGFDVNLVLKSLLKIGLIDGDVVLLLYSRSGGEYEQRRVEEAVKTLKTILAGARAEHYDVAVSGMDFASDVATILDALRQHRRESIVASLVGGMRLIIMEALAALVFYRQFVDSNADISIHVMREDGVYDVTLPLSVLVLPLLGPREASVLEKLGKELAGRPRSEVVSALSRETGITESMAYKVLESLEEKKLIVVRDSAVELTLLGRLVLSALRTASG